MKYGLFLVLLLVAPLGWSCNYADDAELLNDPVKIIQAVQENRLDRKLSLTLSSYLSLLPKSLALLEPHLKVIDINCKLIGVFEGDVIGDGVVSFEEYYRVMARAIQRDDPVMGKNIYLHLKTAPMTLHDFQELYGVLTFAGSGGLEVRDRIKSVFKQHKEFLPSHDDLRDPLIDGRKEDYIMAALFRVFGGTLKLSNACEPYEIHPKFVKEKAGFAGKDLVNSWPTRHLLSIFNYRYRVKKRTFIIENNC
jgi:hypothetical protein